MLSKNKIKLLSSLTLKKNRDELSLFTAEGEKCVCDLLTAHHCCTLVATSEWLSTHHIIADEVIDVDTIDDIKKISSFKTPSPIYAVFEKPQSLLNIAVLQNELTLFLDTVQDPGNLGTIVRIADWFGIKHVICSNDTVDIYNPKAIHATMGAFARVNVHYVDVKEFFTSCATLSIPVYGTFLNGNDIQQTSLTPNGIIVMGNEGNGISALTEHFITHRLFIPNYPIGAPTSESLNVAIATGITCYEFRRRLSK